MKKHVSTDRQNEKRAVTTANSDHPGAGETSWQKCLVA